MNVPVRSTDIQAAITDAALLVPDETRDLLRFLTCGSVDDGKSTLIGRLLFEAGAVPDDQLAMLDKDSERFGTTGGRDFALLVDGLAAEREQGITIDVAYRYFSTARRSFIVADTPGHEQYTRNMATGASTADLAVILIDASKGVLPQTRRHAYIVAMLGIRNVVLAVNKMDLVGYDPETFAAIEHETAVIFTALRFSTVMAIPVSARVGDNITTRTDAMPWYQGPTLIEALETACIAPDTGTVFRFPVQWVNRPNAGFRGFAGLVSSGSINVGDNVKSMPSGHMARVSRIVIADGELASARPGQVPTLVLDREIDVSRGDLIVAVGDISRTVRHIPARLLWMSAKPHESGRKLTLQCASSKAAVLAITLHHGIDIHSYHTTPQDGAGSLGMNEIYGVSIKLDRDLVVVDHCEDRVLGSFILIDGVSGETVGLGIVDQTVLKSRVASAAGRWHQLKHIFKPSGERPMRSITKAVTWRLTGSADTFLLSWLFTQSARLAVAISAAEILTKLALYYGHERLWAQSRFGLADDVASNAENTQGSGI
jgi:sulfate adenylyltransferase large subunit